LKPKKADKYYEKIMAEKAGDRIPRKKTNNIKFKETMLDDLLKYPHLSGKYIIFIYLTI
jgi:hypothetical protein